MENTTDPQNKIERSSPLWPSWQMAIGANIAMSALLLLMVLTGDSTRDFLLGALLSVGALASAIGALLLARRLAGRRARLATRLSIVPAVGAALLQVVGTLLLPAPLATAATPPQQPEQTVLAVLASIPLYPGPLSSDEAGRDMDGNSFRTVHISARDSDVAAAWYRKELTKLPWSVIASARSEKTDPAVFVYRGQKVVSNCIAARFSAAGGPSSIYYWTFLYDSVERGVTVVVQTPDPPVFSDCEEMPVSSR